MFPGQRRITAAFGYDAPHPSDRGTLTLLTHALPSAHYQPVRLPVSVHRCRVPSGFTARTMDHHPRSVTGSPGSRVSNFRTCTGSSDHAGAETLSQVANDSMLPSGPKTPWAPRRFFSFRGSIPGPHVPLSTLRAHGYPNARMTRGQYGLLLLYCKRLSLSVTHRFVPAHFAVGTALTGRPPHRSQRAELPHWAPTSGSDAQSLFGIWMVSISRQAACRIRSNARCKSVDAT